MATTLKHVKSLKDTNITLMEMLNSYIFGDKQIKPYNADKTYNAGDLILYLDENQRISILQCTQDGATGFYDPKYWTRNIVNEFISGKDFNDKTIMLSESQPNEISNLLWYQIVEFKDNVDTSGLSTDTYIVFASEQVVSQDAKPTDSDVTVWFDTEPYENT